MTDRPQLNFPKLDVIAVGAHPDDVEIACGGTLAMLARQGHKVGIIDLTDGEPTPKSPGPEARLAEAQAAAAALGVPVRVTLDLPNRRLFDCFEARVALAKEFRKYRPRLVIGFGDKTPLASPDHWQAVQITDAAVFYSRLTKWDSYFDGLPTHTIAAPRVVSTYRESTARVALMNCGCPDGSQMVYCRNPNQSNARTMANAKYRQRSIDVALS